MCVYNGVSEDSKPSLCLLKREESGQVHWKTKLYLGRPPTYRVDANLIRAVCAVTESGRVHHIHFRSIASVLYQVQQFQVEV